MIGAVGFSYIYKIAFHSKALGSNPDNICFRQIQPHLLSLQSKTPQLIQAAKNRLGKMPPDTSHTCPVAPWEIKG